MYSPFPNTSANSTIGPAFKLLLLCHLREVRMQIAIAFDLLIALASLRLSTPDANLHHRSQY